MSSLLTQKITQRSSAILASAVLGFLLVLGVFTRITFPAFVLLPCLRLLPHFKRQPFSLLSLGLSALATASIAIITDTAFYNDGSMSLAHLRANPIITPLNNILYNSNSENLAQHGIHPYYQHLVANLPQLLGPVFPLLFFSSRKTLLLASAVCGVATLSAFPHQEARFLLPAVPLMLSSVRLPRLDVQRRTWIVVWVALNLVLGLLMGVYHQAGVVPTQVWLANHTNGTRAQTFWWKTYSPPVWLLDGSAQNHTTTDLMGMQGMVMLGQLQAAVGCTPDTVKQVDKSVYLVAPNSATFLDPYTGGTAPSRVKLREVWRYENHINMDDIDFGDDGVLGTLNRVVGRRGIVVWNVTGNC